MKRKFILIWMVCNILSCQNSNISQMKTSVAHRIFNVSGDRMKDDTENEISENSSLYDKQRSILSTFKFALLRRTKTISKYIPGYKIIFGASISLYLLVHILMNTYGMEQKEFLQEVNTYEMEQKAITKDLYKDIQKNYENYKIFGISPQYCNVSTGDQKIFNKKK